MAEAFDSEAGSLGAGPDQVQFRFRDDEPVGDATVTVDAFLGQTNASAVRIEPGDDARDLLPFRDRIALVEVNFPSFGDGRGYSAARILREDGYTGELRAVGDVLVDQLSHMRRCGFDAFAPDRPLDEDDAARALATWPHVYQNAADTLAGAFGDGAAPLPSCAMNEVRRIDRIDVPPRFTDHDAVRLNRMYRGSSTLDVLEGVFRDRLAGDVAVVSSFGAESAVLLHLVAQVDPGAAVLFLDTGKHFPETIAYRDRLARELGLTNLQVLTPDARELAARDETGLRWSYDPDGCCDIRKVAPLARALEGFDASMNGRKAFQSDTRAHLPRFEIDGSDAHGRLKINPLIDWHSADIAAYFEAHDLPPHPLTARGFPSIGRTVHPQGRKDPRSGRWKGWDKSECGIHKPGEEPFL